MRAFQPINQVRPFSRRNYRSWQSSRPKVNLLLTFDAFGTLFEPKDSIAAQYAHVAQEYGITGVEESDIQRTFKQAFKRQASENPNYGKKFGMTPEQWWTNVITNTFTPLTKSPLPPSLAHTLLHRFASKEAYRLFPDALPLLNRLRKSTRYDTVTLGVITNSDHRVTSILNDLGIGVRGYKSTVPGQPHPEKGMGDSALIDFVAFSYDIGYEKPDRKIFDAARRIWNDLDPGADHGLLVPVHAGDDYYKDFWGAQNASWNAILVDERVKESAVTNGWKKGSSGDFVESLEEVYSIVEEIGSDIL
ncbi:HAD-like domain-containing protein [Morchella snyderi]|nr:HAD-like domain-containing protein [Morchella snyderi]